MTSCGIQFSVFILFYLGSNDYCSSSDILISLGHGQIFSLLSSANICFSNMYNGHFWLFKNFTIILNILVHNMNPYLFESNIVLFCNQWYYTDETKLLFVNVFIIFSHLISVLRPGMGVKVKGSRCSQW